MKTIIVVILIAINISSASAQYTNDNLKMESAASASRYMYGYLQLYPVRASKTFTDAFKGLGTYVSLKEALAKKKVKITEHVANGGEDEGEVNTLFIENVSKDTIMVLTGEVVQGGKQDRMIAQDFLLYPGSGRKDVSVFCVEHGRWDAGKDGSSFKNYYSISSNEVRKMAAVNKSQQDVWDKVEETTVKNNAQTSTGTLAALQNSDSLNTMLANYLDYFQGSLMNQADVIGLIAVSGDKVLGCDLFANHELFVKHFPGLIGSYATGAITSGKKVTITREKVDQYFQRLVSDESKQDREIEKNGTLLKDGKRKLHISTF